MIEFLSWEVFVQEPSIVFLSMTSLVPKSDDHIAAKAPETSIGASLPRSGTLDVNAGVTFAFLSVVGFLLEEQMVRAQQCISKLSAKKKYRFRQRNSTIRLLF